MKAIKVPNGIIHIAESKANCPHCNRHIDVDECNERIQKSKNGFTRLKCKGCKRFMGLTCNIMGDFVSYEL